MFQGVASLTAGGPPNPPHLPWSVYAYGLDVVAQECTMGRNPNVIGYPFPQGT